MPVCGAAVVSHGESGVSGALGGALVCQTPREALESSVIMTDAKFGTFWAPFRSLKNLSVCENRYCLCPASCRQPEASASLQQPTREGAGMAGGNYLRSYLLHVLNCSSAELKGMAGRSRAPACCQNYLGCPRSREENFGEMQCGGGKLAGNRGDGGNQHGPSPPPNWVGMVDLFRVLWNAACAGFRAVPWSIATG